MKSKINSFLGLAQRSGNLVTGEDTTERSIKKNDIRLAIIAENASDNTKKKFINMCKYRDMPYVVYGNKEDLSQAIGKHNRTVYGVKDKGLADHIISFIKQEDNVSNNLGGE
ncbi:ribosomal L7Ae/L30e/S12e/Gadd45 family protein [Lutibacter sp. B2]|nr:ribosomal L7Ae/L30e/S12e/Gadd45 family protein [Lutibacter sp. B2]